MVIEGRVTKHYDSVVAITMDGRTVAVARSMQNSFGGLDSALFTESMPGLIGVPFGHMFWQGGEEYFWQYDEFPETRAAFDEQSTRVIQLGARCVHRVLLDPSGWPDGYSDEATESDVDSSMLRWASVGVSDAIEATTWREAGVDPETLTHWRLEGWDDGGIARWVAVGCDPVTAHWYMTAGFSPDDAAVWWRNAGKVHPLTSAAMKAVGTWTATSTGHLRRALGNTRPRLVFAEPWEPATPPSEADGDALLIEWATIEDLSPKAALDCVRAGLSPVETRTLLQSHSWTSSHRR